MADLDKGICASILLYVRDIPRCCAVVACIDRALNLIGYLALLPLAWGTNTPNLGDRLQQLPSHKLGSVVLRRYNSLVMMYQVTGGEHG